MSWNSLESSQFLSCWCAEKAISGCVNCAKKLIIAIIDWCPFPHVHILFLCERHRWCIWSISVICVCCPRDRFNYSSNWMMFRKAHRSMLLTFDIGVRCLVASISPANKIFFPSAPDMHTLLSFYLWQRQCNDICDKLLLHLPSCKHISQCHYR